MNEEKQKQFDRQYLRMAFIWSENSYAIRRKVGAILVRDSMIISDGYNGTPSGFPNVCEYAEDKQGLKMESKDKQELEYFQNHGWSLKTYPYVLHAEANAITKLARYGNKVEGATLYATDSPCLECAKLIIQSGIKRVVYAREYRITDGIDLLKRANIEVVQMTIEGNEEI